MWIAPNDDPEGTLTELGNIVDSNIVKIVVVTIVVAGGVGIVAGGLGGGGGSLSCIVEGLCAMDAVVRRVSK